MARSSTRSILNFLAGRLLFPEKVNVQHLNSSDKNKGTETNMHYQIIKQIPTYIGFAVYVAETPSGEQVVIKRAETELDKQKLQKYVQHVQEMQELVNEKLVYPTLLHYDGYELIMPFYRWGRIDEVGDKAVLRDLTLQAIDTLFRIAAIETVSMPSVEERLRFSRSSIVYEAISRLDRLERAFKENSLARKWVSGNKVEGAMDANGLIKNLTSWITDGSLEQVATRVAAPSLGLASHGDFTLSNVLLREPASSDAAIVFIDTRARWFSGLPWWDPVMDLATLLVFHCRFEPALSDLEHESAHVYYRLSEKEILNICFSSKSFQNWINHDPLWLKRLQIHLAIRLLGNISSQLTVASENQVERATIALGLFAEQVGRVRDTIS